MAKKAAKKATKQVRSATTTISAYKQSTYSGILIYKGDASEIVVTKTNAEGKVVSTSKEQNFGKYIGEFCESGFKNATGLSLKVGQVARLTVTSEIITDKVVGPEPENY